MDSSEIATTHAMMLNIQKQINAQEKASDCDQDPGPPLPKRPRFTVGHCGDGTILGSGASHGGEQSPRAGPPESRKSAPRVSKESKIWRAGTTPILRKKRSENLG